MKRYAWVAVVSLAALASSSSAPAQSAPQPAGEEIRQAYDIEVQAFVPPENVRQPLPYYTEDLKRTGLEGKVVVKGVIDEQGRLQAVRLVSGHPLLGLAARQAVEKWRYVPARRNDKAVAMDLTVTVEFSLRAPAPGAANGAEKAASVAAVSVVTPRVVAKG